MRAIPSSMDSGVVAEIDARLAGVAESEGVTILWAIESEAGRGDFRRRTAITTAVSCMHVRHPTTLRCGLIAT